MTLESSQTWTVASLSGVASFSISAKGVTNPPSIDNTAIEACEVRRSIPRLWRWLIGVDSTSTKYLRLYCSQIGLSRTDLVNTKFRKLLGTVLGGHITPERLRDRTEPWISESLEHRKALPSTRLDTQQSTETQYTDIPKRSLQPTYRPLDQHGDTIRLLSFDQKRTAGTIEASLALSTLSNMTAYRAVSYEWGTKASNESSSLTMILKGHQISIQPNLHRFLTRIQQ
ncbi:hypothetical protein M409DRAFT_58243 [Zasmidium cellare ATCC 36951]|uniref:Heterokaryon incompatibility domain-containing protein n=1 Tax=Zasmidium cellare ATCC 36951 TaxID=1080233 RepID=A0A6A6C6L0_ZASCE|nr:uncharacterized protein M409DRAFT_58243 [Zasmidium cellare ATCC 36951]KAF2162483.1 hypothetical protein M409DRAFT_58243 [Zasmidium cellare ATCC 36951]